MIKRLLIAAVCVSMLFFAAEAKGSTKIDPFFGTVSEAKAFKALSLNKPIEDEDEQVEVFIKSSNMEVANEIVSSLGGKVRTSLGSIMTASVYEDSLPEIALAPEIIFIEAAKPVGKSNDVAGNELGLTEVHTGATLERGLTGSGIVVGIIDTGVDYTHEDFKDADGNNRIFSIWDQSKNLGQGPSELSNTYGTECDAESIADYSCLLGDIDGHGTHVAGTAAGSDDKYGGIAPNANIIVVKYDARLDLESGYANTIFSTKICDAAYYIFSKADQLGMPAVINMSLGTHIGSHDGRSLFEECLSELTSGSAGRALVAAAGNEYSGDWDYTGIHAGFELSDQEMASNFEIRTPSNDGVYYIDIWGTEGGELNVGLAIHDGEPQGSPVDFSELTSSGDTKTGSFLGGKINYMINATDTSSPLNGKPHVGIRILVDHSVSNISSYSFDLVLKGKGSFDAWLFPDKPARTVQFTSISGTRESGWLYVSGDSENSIAIPATSPNIIAVGGYATRTRWTVGSFTWVFNGQQLGELLNFSSSGPTSDPNYTGHKPEIVAPGGMIASTKSSHASVGSQVLLDDGKHFLQAGTSMAAPFVSGTIALMFEANPNFTQGDIRGFLVQSAYLDNFITETPHNRWGYGKLDVLSAVELAINGEASGVFDANGSIAAPNAAESGSGKSSCMLTANSPSNVFSMDTALVICLLLYLVTRRRLRVATLRT